MASRTLLKHARSHHIPVQGGHTFFGSGPGFVIRIPSGPGFVNPVRSNPVRLLLTPQSRHVVVLTITVLSQATLVVKRYFVQITLVLQLNMLIKTHCTLLTHVLPSVMALL